MGSLPRSLQALLHTTTPELTDVLGRARFLARIRSAALAVLPAEAAPHLQVAAYEQHRLRLHVSHGAWATRLRYMSPAIIQALAQRLQLHVDAVEVKIRPAHAASEPAPRARMISGPNRAYMRQVAGYIGDPGLARAIERLASAGEPRDPSDER